MNDTVSKGTAMTATHNELGLKGSYDAISSFPFSLACYKLFVHKIPEVPKTKVSKPKRYSLSKLRKLTFKHAPTCLRQDEEIFA